MTLTKGFKKLLAAALCVTMLTACADGGSSSKSDTGSSDSAGGSGSSSAGSSSAGGADSEAGNASGADSSTPEETPNLPEVTNIAALKGPTAIGMTKLMDEKEGDDSYKFTIAAAADEITPALIQGNLDIACVPANLASVLYNKTEGGIEVLAVNTLGVLYICENGSTVSSVEDLRGKTIYSAGKGSTPEYALNYILKENGIDPSTDVNIEWKSEHSECLAALLEDTSAVAMLPQPFATTAQMKNENIKVVIDLNKAWDDLGTGSGLITGVVIARKAFVEQYPDAVKLFLKSYASSVEYVNANVADAAKLVDKYGIVTAEVAEKAIPACNIVCIQGDEMKQKLSGYLAVLCDQLPDSVGGKLPGDDFYFGA